MVNAIISPKGQLDCLSRNEIRLLQSKSESNFAELFRKCALAVLSTGSNMDDGHALLEAHRDFSIALISSSKGVKLSLENAPENAFVDGKIIAGIRAHLFAVLRDILFLHQNTHSHLSADHITDTVFKKLRHAKAIKPNTRPKLVVCWGGHSISDEEYDYSKEVGYRLGLRGLDICTGCGIGAMKGPMKGAHIAHAKQRISDARYIGISEPGIIASESPNAIVNELIIMPDIEKRLEAFVRLGHAIVVFPGGVGTAEEILYILGILLHPKNQNIHVPLIFTGPASAADYFSELHQFIGLCLGEKAQSLYSIIIDDPIQLAKKINQAMPIVSKNRKQWDDAQYFNWSLHIPSSLQNAFEPSHSNMQKLNLSRQQDVAELCANLRCAFSGIVSGNIKPEGIAAIRTYGAYKIRGDKDIMHALDALLERFVAQKRMKLSGEYTPCYQLQHTD